MKNDSTENKPLEPIKWKGEHTFYISGTDHEDDTIRIPSTYRKDEILHKLILPTLCITYADMKFANDIGGVQADFPDSKVYGNKYFDPPVELNGEEEIEKFTWIRGAKKVTIGPKVTVIEWWGFHDLVIPKLRIRPKEKVGAKIRIPEVNITVSQPFVAKVLQYADGRHVGGIEVTKRHPMWKEEAKPEVYDLFIRVIEGEKRCAIPELEIKLYTWDKQKKWFVLESTFFTNGMGVVDVNGLPCSDKKLIVIAQAPWVTQTWRFRPLSGQKVKRSFRLWCASREIIPYVWRKQDTLRDIAVLTGSSKVEILKMNRLRSSNELAPGKVIEIPCFEAIYHVKQRDTFERIVDYFCYQNVEEIAKVNGLAKPYRLHEDQELRLPGWFFLQARSDELFERIDEQFGVPGGWTRPVQRVLHDDPARAYENEFIAVPTKKFVSEHADRMKRLY